MEVNPLGIFNDYNPGMKEIVIKGGIIEARSMTDQKTSSMLSRLIPGVVKRSLAGAGVDKGKVVKKILENPEAIKKLDYEGKLQVKKYLEEYQKSKTSSIGGKFFHQKTLSQIDDVLKDLAHYVDTQDKGQRDVIEAAVALKNSPRGKLTTTINLTLEVKGKVVDFGRVYVPYIDNKSPTVASLLKLIKVTNDNDKANVTFALLQNRMPIGNDGKVGLRAFGDNSGDYKVTLK